MSLVFNMVGGGSGGGVTSFKGRTGSVIPASGDYTAEMVGAYSKEETDTLLQKKVNPNLLDNWYFGNPVDQRGGYVVPPGVTYYNLSDSSIAGQTDGYVKVDKISTDGYENAIITISGTNYYVRKTGYVRGYTGAGYGIDRWKILNHPLSIQTGSIKVTCNSASAQNYALQQLLENPIVGEQYTISALILENTTTSGISFRNGAHGGATILGTGLFSDTFTADNTMKTQGVGIQFYNRVVDNGKYVVVKAIKLELGTQQTLAHKENGVWVLNEVSDYGEQLRRCQRYFVNFNPYKMPWFAMPPAVASNTYHAYSTVTLPVAMRAQPVVAYGGNIMLSQEANHAVTSISVSDNTFTGNSIQLKYEEETGSLTANSLYRVQGGYDASAYIWLSADL